MPFRWHRRFNEHFNRAQKSLNGPEDVLRQRFSSRGRALYLGGLGVRRRSMEIGHPLCAIGDGRELKRVHVSKSRRQCKRIWRQ